MTHRLVGAGFATASPSSTREAMLRKAVFVLELVPQEIEFVIACD